MGTIGTLIVALPLVFILPRTTQAQDKKIAHYNQVWFAYLNQTRFTDKWGLWVDAHLRTKEDFFTAFSQSILRLGVTYYLNDVTKLAAGYAYVSNYPVDNHENVTQPEHGSGNRSNGIINMQRSGACNGFGWKKSTKGKF